MDATAGFFAELARRRHEPLLEKATGTLRFDLESGQGTKHWLVGVRSGDVEVSRANATADCVVRTDKALFDDMAVGKANALAAMLRGLVGLEGDLELLVLFQRVLPGPESPGKGRGSERSDS